MNRAQSTSRPSVRSLLSRGFTYRGLLFAIPAVVAVPLLTWLGLPKRSWSSEEAGPAVCVVERGTFIHEVTEHGDVESANNVDVRCEVQSYGGGVMILWIIPEGTYVEPAPDWEPREPDEEPPDLLVKLDSSSLEKERTKQEIVCNTSEAEVIQARNNYETAVISKEEYLEGTYAEQKKKMLGDIVVAEQRLSRAKEYLEYSRSLHAKGYIPDRELQANEFDVERKEIDLEKAKTSLDVLENYTKRKMLLQLEAKISTTKARLESEEHSHQIDLDELARVEDQIAKCTIRAPQAGQVVYANVTDHHGNQEIVIEEGTMIRERQAIIRLPDPQDMQVRAKINEARITSLEKGMPVTVELDAFPGTRLSGTVEKVNEYPLPSGWWAGNVKEYEAIVKIKDFPADLDLRPGMTAKVSIRVEQLSDVLVVPVEAVLAHGSQNVCVVRNARGLEARPVVLGPTNDKEVVVEKGLEEGEQVVLGAALYCDQLDLPEPPQSDVSEAPGGTLSKAPGDRPGGTTTQFTGANSQP
jgi:HlyD family secretion protein